MFFKIFFSVLLFTLPILAEKSAAQNKKNPTTIQKKDECKGLLGLFHEGTKPKHKKTKPEQKIIIIFIILEVEKQPREGQQIEPFSNLI